VIADFRTSSPGLDGSPISDVVITPETVVYMSVVATPTSIIKHIYIEYEITKFF
jgi:hypothetical protein